MFKKKTVVAERPLTLAERADSASAVASSAIYQFEVAIVDLEQSADEHDLVAQVALADADKVSEDADYDSDVIEAETEALCDEIWAEAVKRIDLIEADAEFRINALLENSTEEVTRLVELAEFSEQQARSSREAAQKFRNLIGYEPAEIVEASEVSA